MIIWLMLLGSLMDSATVEKHIHSRMITLYVIVGEIGFRISCSRWKRYQTYKKLFASLRWASLNDASISLALFPSFIKFVDMPKTRRRFWERYKNYLFIRTVLRRPKEMLPNRWYGVRLVIVTRDTELNNSTIIPTVIISMPQWFIWPLYERRTNVWSRTTPVPTPLDISRVVVRRQ